MKAEDVVKGRVAEALIEELFLQADFDVYRFGMENTIPGVMKRIEVKRNSKTAIHIRKMPDFVVQNKNGDVYFIEVKFRRDETFRKESLEEIETDYPFSECFFIVVSKNHIKCITYNELHDGKEVTPTSDNYLGKRKEFDLDRNLINDFRELASKLFANV